uniref:RNA-directed DNA polymerase, eukaryota, reverse transcriptase zinc-binding domain protein n=1 Tax=Tanacetum cinerariifolium TaxID=118510 RepID=A0A699HZH1_TANCI|nr:RNA-directed DNA polymerase, eukaryota, reverse transcriptase zinc-binding domain protein [Tanacetum cinerariifolium]
MMNYFKRLWEANKEKERDKRLDDMEGLVKDALGDDNEVVQNLVTDELEGTNEKIYCSFIYADNKDFNVTLKPDEHSAGSSVISGDMKEFIDCVNAIEVEDVCSTGMHYTWIKSPSSPATSVMKKLNRVLADKDFWTSITKLLCPLVTKCWFDDIDEFHMFKLAKKLKGLKKHLKGLQWKNGDLFKRVEKLKSKLKETQMNINKFPFDSKIKELAATTLEEFNEAIIDAEKQYFSKALTDDEAVAMVSDVSDHEVKSVMFSIKVLTNRIKGSLNKLINLNQSAFIKGRNIQDNILLTHEILKGYNRKGHSKRYALKIYIAKAYDTNDANSLIFKFHPGCQDLKLTHLCFVSDLLAICHGSVDSVKVIKESIKDFSRVSGLEPNLNKNTIFFGNVKAGDQRSTLNVLPFSVGKFLIKYLGVHLITKRLGREECKQLIDRVKYKVDD